MAAKQSTRKSSRRHPESSAYRFAFFLASVFTAFLVAAVSMPLLNARSYNSSGYIVFGQWLAAAVMIFALVSWLGFAKRCRWSWWAIITLPIFFTVMGVWSIFNSLLVSTDYYMLTRSLDVPLLLISISVLVAVLEPNTHRSLTS